MPLPKPTPLASKTDQPVGWAPSPSRDDAATGLARSPSYVLLAAICLLAACKESAPDATPANSTPPETGIALFQTANTATLTIDGQPFRIKGAGGPNSWQKLAAAGANATRTWGFDQLENGALDDAHANGLKVAAGIWLRHDLDYNDPAQAAEQIRLAVEGVRRYKDHPAILLWGIGNEMEGAGDRMEVWEHVEAVAKAVKAEDHDHPVMTVLAEIGGTKVKDLNRLCPSIDIVGINSYGGAPLLPKRYRKAGGTKPYVLTEFGPRGSWDLAKNAIGSVDEELGKVKAANYLESFRAVHADTELCLGSFAFIWGHKQEATPTWFGMFLPDGRKTAAVDVMTEAWSGNAVANRCPQIDALTLEKTDGVRAGSVLKAELDAIDPEGKPLKVDWVLMANSGKYVTGGYHQDTPPSFPESLLESATDAASFRVPEKPGLYRIFAYVGDGEGADVANVVFRVVP